MQDILNSLHRLSALETELGHSKFLPCHDADDEGRSRSTSPRGVVVDRTTLHHPSLIQRYEQARNLYLQRRLENLLVDHIATFQSSSSSNDDDDDDDEGDDHNVAFHMELPVTNDKEHEELRARNEEALQRLQASLSTLHTQVDQLKHTRDAVQSRRQELERMVHDLQQQDTPNTKEEDKDDEDPMDQDDDAAAFSMDLETALEGEQIRLEELQKRKRMLQDRLEQVQRQAKEAQDRAHGKQEQAQLLQQQESSSSSSENAEEMQRKLQELVEMKDFYDSLRQVLEELGGVKIVSVEEVAQDNNNKTPNLSLSLLFYELYPVNITLQVYRKVFLKLVDARWKTTNDEEPLVVQAANKDYALPLEPLQDLVHTAISTLGPPHDLRFIVRETLARIRLSQVRADQLSELRNRYIMKLYGNQVTCSLNEGIVIVLRLYEKYVKLDDLVGINGWDHAATQELRTNVQRRLETEYAQEDADIALFGSKVTPLVVVELVQEEIRRRASSNPRTPRMPVRGNGAKGGF